MKKPKNLCTDCMQYVENGKTCPCQSKKADQELNNVLLADGIVKMRKPAKKKLINVISGSPFSGAGILFSSEIDVFND